MVNTEEARFRAEIFAWVHKLGLIVSDESTSDCSRLKVDFGAHFPMWLTIDIEPDDGRAFLVGIVRTWGLPGDRSDYHDLISLLWAALLRCLNLASVRLIDIPHPVCEGELYGRKLIFDKQPAASYISLSDPSYELIARIMEASALAAKLFSTVFRALGGDNETEILEHELAEDWARQVARCLRFRPDHRLTLANHRHRPGWSY